MRHPTLGEDRQNTEACSRCGQAIPEDHVPLIMWETKKEKPKMWVYCEACEGRMFGLFSDHGEEGNRELHR